jgi:hypothetical protein
MHNYPTAVMLSPQAFPTIYPFQYILFSKIFSLIPFKHFIFASLLKNELLQKDSNGVVVQLVRMPACHARGRGFESRPLRKSLQIGGFFVYPNSSL